MDLSFSANDVKIHIFLTPKPMKIKTIVTASLITLSLTGCASGAKLGNVGIPGDASNVSTNTIGKNNQLVYMTGLGMNEACMAQEKIIVAANLKPTEDSRTEATYKRTSFKDEKSLLTVVCSEQREGEKFMGTKVTLTLENLSE